MLPQAPTLTSSLKFLHTARSTLHPSTNYELVDALSLFSKIPQLGVLWLWVIMGLIGEYALPSAGDLAEHGVVVLIFFQATLTKPMIHSNSRHVLTFSMIHCLGLRQLHLEMRAMCICVSCPHWIADIVLALNHSACHTQ
jgi:hypothetical protein